MCCHKKRIGILIKCLDKKIVHQLNKALEAYDLTLIQHEVLAYLYRNQDEQDVYQKDIEEFLESSNPTITGIVKRLEAKGLIQREPSLHDARFKKLTLTEKGKHIFEETIEVGPKKLEQRLTKNLGVEEVEKLIDLLERAIAGIDDNQ